ncbi:ABC transporter ATP-binding protein [Candidatus Sumerlaeota bacterium]|nr:ABC transporter ATP-binding protein [Candidatus Sumerlaeota bacterium]
MLKVDNLTKIFGKTRAVDDLSFELEEGDVCGFIGPNGAGKTTTMRIIATLEEPTDGQVRVGGESIHEEPYRIRRRIGFMPDHYGTYPDMTCRDYLEFYARAYEIEPKARARRIDGIMDFTGLGDIADKKVEELSKGMRQRLNLSRALINDPKLMVMDEPAAGLDPRARVELRYLIRNLAEQGKTVFVSSHILTELSEICDHMLIIDQGRKISFGSVEEIQRGLREGFEIRVRLVDPSQVEGLVRFLVQRPGIQDVRPGENGVLLFSLRDEAERIPALLREAVNEGFSVMEFRPETPTMEDVFMRITGQTNGGNNGNGA